MPGGGAWYVYNDRDGIFWFWTKCHIVYFVIQYVNYNVFKIIKSG